MNLLDKLPALNATLNSVAFIFLLLGWRQVKSGQVEKHKKTMKAAFLVSVMFLISYLCHHTLGEETKFTATGFVRTVYFFILITHIPLAALMVVPILLLVRWGIKDEIHKHKKLARIVLPVWVYVSLTGVLIYLMLYVWFPSA